MSEEGEWMMTLIDPDRRRYLSEVAILAGELEYNVHALAIVLIDPADFRVGEAVTRSLQLQQMLELCDKLVPIRVDDPDLLAMWADRTRDASKAMKGRNHVLHGYWLSQLGGIDPTTLRLDVRNMKSGARERKDVSAQHLRQTAEDLQAVGLGLRQVLASVAHELGALEALIDWML